MSQITANSGAGATSERAGATTPKRFVAPKASMLKALNFRIVLLAAIAFIFIGFPFFIWARDFLGGGIVNHGDYAEVNLKAMSGFDLDQMNGQPTDVPLRFRELEGKRVALVGQMWAPNYAADGSLTYFLLCDSRRRYDQAPLAQQFVYAYVRLGVPAHYDDGKVRVWGTLHIKFRRDPTTGVIKSVYACDVDRIDDM
jgi:hypothetical protein